MDENPYRSPATVSHRTPKTQRRRSLRHLVGIPGVLLMFAFAFMVGVTVFDQIGSANGLMRLGPRRLIGFGPVMLLGLSSFLSGLFLAARMCYEWLRPEAIGPAQDRKSVSGPAESPPFP